MPRPRPLRLWFGVRKMTVNEAGLYEALRKSDKPFAKDPFV